MLSETTSNCYIQNYSQNFINVGVQDPVKGLWRLTLFYGFPHANQRRQSWDMLRQLVPPGGIPWCIIGDFNDILEVGEKKGVHDRPTWMITCFSQAMQDCELLNIPLEGYPFTWSKSLGTDWAV